MVSQKKSPKCFGIYWNKISFSTDLGDEDHNATYWSYVQEVIDSLDPLQPELIQEGKT